VGYTADEVLAGVRIDCPEPVGRRADRNESGPELAAHRTNHGAGSALWEPLDRAGITLVMSLEFTT
jgi:hypothetical protein